MKKLISIAISILFLFTIVGCGGQQTSGGQQSSGEANTMGGKFVEAFNLSTGADSAAVVDELIANVTTPYELAQMEVTPGYLNGFDAEIKGFSKGVVFSPMIGSIPFVGYVFETDDPDALEAELKGSANMRWNICTEADEMVTAKKDKLVFFMMCTNDEQ